MKVICNGCQQKLNKVKDSKYTYIGKSNDIELLKYLYN